MKYLTEIKKIKWVVPVTRREAILFNSISTFSNLYFKEAVGWEWKFTGGITLNNGKVARDSENINDLKEIIKKGGVKLLKDFKEKLIERVKEFDKYADYLKDKDFSNMSYKEIREITKKYFQKALMAHAFLIPVPIADNVLSEIILKEVKTNENLSILTFPEKENFHNKEERDFLKLVKHYRKEEYNELLKKHVEKYARIGARNYYWQYAWTKEDVDERVRNYVSQKKDPEEDLRHLDGIRREIKEKSQKLIEELNIDEEMKSLIKLAKELAYLRTWRTDVMYGAGYKVRELFYEIAKKVGIQKDDIAFCSYLEVLQMLENWENPVKNLEERKKQYALVLYNRECNIYSDKKDVEELNKLFESKEIENIKGLTAHPGKAKGKAKIVFEPGDLYKVEKGDILVSIMTFPHFISAMEKAAAFVTDEGGILCHAAIISREMRKPCVIGTKNATHVLKDGDMVEVDGENGVVRKIS